MIACRSRVGEPRVTQPSAKRPNRKLRLVACEMRAGMDGRTHPPPKESFDVALWVGILVCATI